MLIDILKTKWSTHFIKQSQEQHILLGCHDNIGDFIQKSSIGKVYSCTSTYWFDLLVGLVISWLDTIFFSYSHGVQIKLQGISACQPLPFLLLIIYMFIL